MLLQPILTQAGHGDPGGSGVQTGAEEEEVHVPLPLLRFLMQHSAHLENQACLVWIQYYLCH